MDQARTILRDIRKDPARTLIVIDPRRSETTDYADIHLAVKAGRDAWCMAAILGHGEMAQKDAAPGTALRRHVDAAMSAGLRAKLLVERILAFSRAGLGERPWW